MLSGQVDFHMTRYGGQAVLPGPAQGLESPQDPPALGLGTTLRKRKLGFASPRRVLPQA